MATIAVSTAHTYTCLPILQVRREGGIHPTDGDGTGGPISGENGNRTEERHGETETMDNEIHEPHD